MAIADLCEQGHAFFARRGVGGEIHVLHHQVEAAAAQHRQSLVRRQRAHRVDVFQREQDLDRGGDRGIVIDYKDSRHAR